jgi:hypothetical protein
VHDPFEQLPFVRRILRRLTTLEVHMATEDEKIAEISTGLDAVAAEITDLQGKILAGDTAAAEKLTPIVERITGMAPTPPAGP